MDYYQRNHYNQANPYNANQINSNKSADAFAIASFICGIVSIISCCTLLGSFIGGALGIIFALLARRNDRPTPPFSIAGLITSGIGLVFALFLLIYSLFTISTSDFQELYKEYEQYYEEIYGNYYTDSLEYTNESYDNETVNENEAYYESI